MQRVFNGLAHRLMNAVGHQRIEARTFVDFVEVWNRFPFVQLPFSVAAFHRWAIFVIEGSFNQVTGRHDIFQALLILDANSVAAEIISDANRSDIHFALRENLIVG